MRAELPFASHTSSPCLGSSLPLSSDDDNNSSSSATRPYGMSSSASSSSESRIRPLGAPKDVRGEVQPLKFKTQMCAHFLRGERCPYDPWCAFAHGESELRSVEGNFVDGVEAVNTLPRTLVYHEEWVQTTKYTRKTGPAAPSVAMNAPPPRPSFMAKKPEAVRPAVMAPAPIKFRQHNPYGANVFDPATCYTA